MMISKDGRIQQRKCLSKASASKSHLFCTEPIVVLKNLRRFCQLLHLLVMPIFVASLTSEERGELARKFKYYHKSVRPSEQFNMVDTVNGTFFRLLTQLELVETRELQSSQLGLELALFIHFRDDRLQLRDLPEMPIPIPEEFQPWQPRVQIFPLGTTRNVQMQRSTNLSPKNGQLTVVLRFSGPITCDFEPWKMPFQEHRCQFWFETDPDERLHLTVLRDLRPNGQLFRIHFDYEQWPWFQLNFSFQSAQWQWALVAVYLPSLLLFCCALLAQWKRRKVQVMVSLGALLAVLLIQFRQQQQQQLAMATTAVTLLDLWLAGIFVHLICLLSADLLLPARRVLVFKRAAIQSVRQPRQGNAHWHINLEGANQRRGRGDYASPLAMIGRKLGGSRKDDLSPTERVYHQPATGRPLRAIFYPHSSTSLHHYVSSPQLGHKPVPRQRAVALFPTALPTSSPSPAQMIRTFSVPPRRLDDVRRQLEPPLPQIGGSAPLSRKRTQPEAGEVGNGEGGGDERERAIASLLSEMESIRRAETQGIGQAFRRATSSEEEELGASGPSELSALRMASQQPPPIPPTQPPPNGFGRFRVISRPQSPWEAEMPSNGEEVARLDSEGIPRRKRLVLYAINLSFCLFLGSYLILVIAALFDWI